ncbi:uncharacterized protein Bfra_005542 [Botrytis fragariae]|uniref:Uncharacterized protein n=1 Tax=Botrytis fragariae TaxID=1964551 RepID=A0A8H6ARH5_9HELO|nr:uncharacterized protein Bfra_005542 [Botrytis fragariae]KAF5872188.1 hypothetical protein Bfra_005542 [Botrytis fragariae]
MGITFVAHDLLTHRPLQIPCHLADSTLVPVPAQPSNFEVAASDDLPVTIYDPIDAQTLKLKDDCILATFLADPNLCYHFHNNFVQRPFQDFELMMARNDFPIAVELHKYNT